MSTMSSTLSARLRDARGQTSAADVVVAPHPAAAQTEQRSVDQAGCVSSVMVGQRCNRATVEDSSLCRSHLAMLDTSQPTKVPTGTLADSRPGALRRRRHADEARA